MPEEFTFSIQVGPAYSLGEEDSKVIVNTLQHPDDAERNNLDSDQSWEEHVGQIFLCLNVA